MEDEPRNVTITPLPAEISSSGGDPVVWISDSFARDWFTDALREARTGKDYNARRREIIFAICFAESYIFEWTRHKIQIEEINDYFPPSPRFDKDPRYRRTLKDKWGRIPREIFDAKKIPAHPNLKLAGLGTLLKYRNGLVHASASEPATDSQPPKTKPFPTKEMLKRLKPGWAVKIVVDLVKDLHREVGDSVPEYIEYP